MHELHELRDKLCEELEKYGRDKELTAGSLDIVDKLAHSIKNLDKIIYYDEEEGYSGRYYYGRKRDRMGRYSRAGFADKLHELMNDAPDDKTREEIRRLAEKM